MMAVRSALPQRSPMPLTVPCTCRTPAATAANELATPSCESLWQWIPSVTPGVRRATSSTTCLMNSGMDPPLVSHRHSVVAPADTAAASVRRA